MNQQSEINREAFEKFEDSNPSLLMNKAEWVAWMSEESDASGLKRIYWEAGLTHARSQSKEREEELLRDFKRLIRLRTVIDRNDAAELEEIKKKWNI